LIQISFKKDGLTSRFARSPALLSGYPIQLYWP
jgi:hypothetical protein